MSNMRTESGPPAATARPRPPVLRALGRGEPPDQVRIAGAFYRLDRVLKHDSWAATAIYETVDADAQGQRVICKFNRRQSIFIIPMGWLGRKLARNEESMLRALADSPHVPRWTGKVESEGRILLNAVAHDYVEGRPLQRYDRVGDDFFPKLRGLLDLMHQRGLAYVDLHKRENILVGDDGLPYLIDFQISYALPKRWPGRLFLFLSRRWLGILQRSDDYHFLKHFAKSRPDLCGQEVQQVRADRPWWIRAHRAFARPFRALRRKLLVLAQVRRGAGRATSERFAEEAVRLEAAHVYAPANAPAPHFDREREGSAAIAAEERSGSIAEN